MRRAHAVALGTGGCAGAGLVAGLVVSMAGAEVHARPREGCSVPSGQVSAVGVTWGRVTSSAGCFFFSGPGELGRDDRLGGRAGWLRAGNRLAVSFEGNVFQGLVEGDRVELRRVSAHAFDSTWTVTETITGRLGAPGDCLVLDAAYSYGECDESHVQGCPGSCTIAAPVRFDASPAG